MAGDKIASSSSDARWHARLALLLAASGRYESAAAHFRRALQGLQDGVTPEEDAQTRRQRLQWQFELAAVEARRGRHHDAVRLYEEVLQSEPQCVEAQVNLAAQLAVADASRLEDSLQLCEQALGLRPDFAEAHYNRNMLMRRLGRQQEAVATYWELLAREIGADAIREAMPDGLARAVLPLDEQSREPRAYKPSGVPSEDTTCNQVSDGDGVTVVCVKWGAKYGPELPREYACTAAARRLERVVE
ncbi:Tetratricopeptide TPR2 [Phytophthora cinnamomi]|uniref:Tetratricopeptide TPR2 n=1 Tax=Phytophthora cinnamomi TaxID=4785 RepID=UPI00355A7E01|nr:Tetratricopeptide TPR2 [Phytophthora cinnamomi]